MPWLGLGIAPFKAFRESEAIGNLAWCGIGMPCLALACRALALACLALALRWHVLPWPWHALRWHVLPCLGIGIARHVESEAIGILTCHALPCLALRWHVLLWPWHALALACLALAWHWHCKACRE